MVRRAGRERGAIIYGTGAEDKVTRLSKARKTQIAEWLEIWDKANMEGDGEEWYKSSSLTTPEKPKGKGKGKNTAGEEGGSSDGEDGEGAGIDRRRPSDLPRLIGIIFSDDHWEDVCRSEQGSNNRSANKSESKLSKQNHPVWRKVAAAFVNPELKDQGSLPSHPVDHRKNGHGLDVRMELELEAMYDMLDDMDYIAPVKRCGSRMTTVFALSSLLRRERVGVMF